MVPLLSLHPQLTNVDWVDILYGVCIVSLPVATILVLISGGRQGNSVRRTLRYRFAWTAFYLLIWVASLYVFHHYRGFGLADDPSAVLWLGRVNFAAVVFVVYFAYRFVQVLAGQDRLSSKTRLDGILLAETWVVALGSLLTPLVDKAEIISTTAQTPTTVYGVLFPLYVVHVVAYLFATIRLALIAREQSTHPVRDQLGLVTIGILATGGISLVTNAALPYLLGDFRFTDIGTLSTILFLLAVGWAVARHQLFDLRLFLSRTLVYGLLLSLVVSAYSAVVVLVTERLTAGNQDALTQFSVLVIASSFDPVRRFLEAKVDALLFHKAGRNRVKK